MSVKQVRNKQAKDPRQQNQYYDDLLLAYLATVASLFFKNHYQAFLKFELQYLEKLKILCHQKIILEIFWAYFFPLPFPASVFRIIDGYHSYILRTKESRWGLTNIVTRFKFSRICIFQFLIQSCYLDMFIYLFQKNHLFYYLYFVHLFIFFMMDCGLCRVPFKCLGQ